MLVLSRKEGESIIVAGNITLTVMSVGQGRVKIGIKAPTDVLIDRAEIHEKKLHDDAAVPVGVVEMDAATAGPGSMPPAIIVNRILQIESSRPARPSDFRKKSR